MIPTFKDAEGREWTTRISVATMARVQAEAGVDLRDPDSWLDAGPLAQFKTIVAVIRPQIDARKLDAEAFGESLAEEHLMDAMVAVIEGLIEFLSAERRPKLRQALDAWKAASHATQE